MELISKLGVPGSTELRLKLSWSGVAALRRAILTSAGSACGLLERYTAARPATCGTAMLVPLAHVYAESFSTGHLPTHCQCQPLTEMRKIGGASAENDVWLHPGYFPMIYCCFHCGRQFAVAHIEHGQQLQ